MSHPNLTPKQEAFVQAYRRLNNQRQAWREAYDGENTSDAAADVAACRLLKNAKVALRLHQLQERAAQKTEVTVESITAELRENRALALANNQSAAATAASMGLAKLHGLIIEKRDIKMTVSHEDALKQMELTVNRVRPLALPVEDIEVSRDVRH